MLKNLWRSIGERLSGKQSWTPVDVRDLIDAGRLDEAEAATAALTEQTPDRELQALCLRGEVAFRQHRDDDAEQHFRAALSAAPGLSAGHYGLSLLLLARGDREAALRHAQFAVNQSLESRFCAQLGLCHLELGNYKQAYKSLSLAARQDPNDKSSWNNLGIVLRSQGEMAGALGAFRRALSIDPNFESAAVNLRRLEAELREAGAQVTRRDPPAADAGIGRLEQVRALALAGDGDAAIEACEALSLDQPDDREVVLELYRLYRAKGDARSGLDALEAFLASHPDDIGLLGELGRALVAEQQYKKAKPLIQRALEHRPTDVALLVTMSDIRVEQGRFSDAGELLEQAYAIDASSDVKGKLAANLVMRCEYHRALALVDEMLAENSELAEAVLSVRVEAYTQLGRHDEALPILDDAVARHPNEPNRRFPRASIHLLNERFAEGWDDYALRNLSSTKHLRMVPFPQWRGEPLAGKTILVLAEQGLGDQVMFASCLPDLLALSPARTIVEVVERVAPTIARSFPECEIVSTKQDAELTWVRDLGAVDYFVPMGDLPQRFRGRREDFPAHAGYLRAAPERVDHWRQRLAVFGDRPRIGVSWRGGTEQTRRVVRTLDIAALQPLMSGRDATWVCLQYGDVSADIAKAADLGMTLQYWPQSIKDLDEFAALISALDLVVTVCNTTVHYAGALGRPVWVMSPRIPEWRYGLKSRGLPWYPSSVIYRQEADGDWPTVLAKVGHDLSSFLPGRP